MSCTPRNLYSSYAEVNIWSVVDQPSRKPAWYSPMKNFSSGLRLTPIWHMRSSNQLVKLLEFGRYFQRNFRSLEFMAAFILLEIEILFVTCLLAVNSNPVTPKISYNWNPRKSCGRNTWRSTRRNFKRNFEKNLWRNPKRRNPWFEPRRISR